MNYTTKQHALLTHGYIQSPYPARLEKEVDFMLKLWKAFCEQNLKHKQQYTFARPGGYEYKGPTEKDYKENFHISLNYDHSLDDTFVSKTDTDFFSHAKKLINNNIHVVEEIIDTMDIYGTMREMIITSKDIWTLRLLHYPKRPYCDEKFLAVAHPDKAGITIHLTETMEGLEVLWNASWKPISKMAHHIIAYPGLTTQYHTKGLVKGLTHRVRMMPEIEKESRYSIVLFIDFGDIFYNKTLGNTAEIFPNGENYLLGFKEFSKYFLDQPNIL